MTAQIPIKREDRMRIRTRRFAQVISLQILGLLAPGIFGFAAHAQTAAVGGGLDCNGWSPISPNIKHYLPCTDPHGANGGRFYDHGWYIGHDEPSVQFFSNRPGSGNNMVWRIRLPERDPVPTQSGSSVATFELTTAIWFSLAVCDPQSYPLNPCTPNSDSNASLQLPTDAGSAALELQFYPPGWPPFITQISCDATHWCAALNIDSLECSFQFASCNPNCTEPANFAFLQNNGVPTGPPAPGQQTNATFTPNANTLLMNPGDDLLILIRDSPRGLLTLVQDLTTGEVGFMIAGAESDFANTDSSTCQTTPFNFHPEFSTASPQNGSPWTALFANVNLAVETGHFELKLKGDKDADDAPCFPGPTIAGCYDLAIGGDLDFDGPPYRPDWPDGSKKHPSPILLGALNGQGIGPMSFVSDGSFSFNSGESGYSGDYHNIQFKTDVPLSDSSCNPANGVGCVVPPNGAAFYPFYNQIGTGSACRLAFGNDIPDETTNDFGKDAQYGSFLNINGFGFGNFGPIIPNPCTP
jgi:hypothetical protein